MEAGKYEVEITEVGTAEAAGKEYVYLNMRVLGENDYPPQEMKFYFINDENVRISMAQMKQLGWSGDWGALSSELVGTTHELNYGRSKCGQYWNWTLPYASSHNASVLEKLSVKYATPPKKDPNAPKKERVAAAKMPSSSEIPF